MGASQRIYEQKIKSTQTLKKMFRAMELIAASRIGRARDRAIRLDPYSRAITRSVSAVASHSDVQHTLTSERTDTNDVAMLVITSDRGMAGAYSATILREAERLHARLVEEGRNVKIFTLGRRGASYFQFREIEVEESWVGNSDSPQVDQIQSVARTLLERFLAPADEGGVAELHVVFTQFRSMVSQEPRVARMLPLEIVDGVSAPSERALPLYEFEPSAEEVLDALLPRYVESRIFNMVLQAAASELAARQRAMHTATENAEELIRNYTRLKNTARQAEITQEISEIVSGADALAAS